MKDYIEREAAIEAVTRAKLPDTTPDGVPIANGKRSVTDCVRRIKSIPAADVKPVVRGEWIEWWPGDCALIMTGEEMLWMCGECTAKFSDQSSFCPNCGADMRGEN